MRPEIARRSGGRVLCVGLWAPRGETLGEAMIAGMRRGSRTGRPASEQTEAPAVITAPPQMQSHLGEESLAGAF